MQPDAKLQGLIAKAPRWEPLAPPLAAEKMPRHIAIIMDGNGRWATQRGMVRINGHQAGVETVRKITRYCGQIKLRALTLYAFSTENWKRPKAEVRFLFRMLRKYLVEERAELMANDVRLTSIGNIAQLPEDVQSELRLTESVSVDNKGLNLCLALNYGAHDEILTALRRVADQVADGKMSPSEISEATIEQNLYTAGMPPLDLLIRTAGERRLSNFLLWQACGAEFYVTPLCWPEFRQTELEAAIHEYAARRAHPDVEY
ncbi:MAG TPA: polyprenyl diphosphate synthase [Planctomycetota bacterium]|jgi:undecaprenyl diphosphate synthase